MWADGWNATMGVPMAVAAGRFVGVAHKDRIPFVGRQAQGDGASEIVDRDGPATSEAGDGIGANRTVEVV